MTVPSLTRTFPPSATLLSPTRIDVTASNGICKGPFVPRGSNFHELVLHSPAEIHIVSRENQFDSSKILGNMAGRCYTFFLVKLGIKGVYIMNPYFFYERKSALYFLKIYLLMYTQFSRGNSDIIVYFLN